MTQRSKLVAPLGEPRILLLLAFIGSVIAGAMPLALSVNELGTLNASVRQINEAASAARQSRRIFEQLSEAMTGFTTVAIELEAAEAASFQANTDKKVSAFKLGVANLENSISRWLNEQQKADLIEAIDDLAHSWEEIMAQRSSLTNAEKAFHFLQIVESTQKARELLLEIENRASNLGASQSQLFFERLKFTGNLLVGAILIGFLINAVGSISIFRSLQTARKANADLEGANAALSGTMGQLAVANENVRLSNEALGKKNAELSSFNESLEKLVSKRTAEAAAAAEQARIASEVKSKFLASMSHEIRTPLNGVLGMADILARTTLTTHQNRLVTTITESAHTLLAIINGLLDLSRIEAGKVELEQVEFDLRQCAESAIELLAETANAKQLALNLLVPSSLPERRHRRPGAIASNARQSGRKRGKVHIEGRGHGARELRWGARRQVDHPVCCLRYRHRDRPHDTRSAVQTVCPGRQLYQPQFWRHGSRAVDHAELGSDDGWTGQARERVRQGYDGQFRGSIG
jgi:signal transduction histidine kinase